MVGKEKKSYIFECRDMMDEALNNSLMADVIDESVNYDINGRDVTNETKLSRIIQWHEKRKGLACWNLNAEAKIRSCKERKLNNLSFSMISYPVACNYVSVTGLPRL